MRAVTLRTVGWMAASMLAAARVATGQSFQPGGPLMVRDSQGRIVGQLVGAYQVSAVVDGRVVLLAAFRGGLTDPSVGLAFDQPDCQGNAFMLKRSTDYYMWTPAAFGPTGALHIVDHDTPAQVQTLVSFYQNYTDSTTGQCTNQNPAVYPDAVRTVQTSFQRNHFTPPLSVVPAVAPASVPAVGRVGVTMLVVGLALTGLLMLFR
jgi:hypothetical protein